MNKISTNESSVRILRAAHLSKLLGISQTTLWRWRRDPTNNLPSPVALGPRVVGWRVNDINNWLNNK